MSQSTPCLGATLHAWGPPQGAFLHGMESRARKEAGRRGHGAMWWVVCGRGLLMWGVTMPEIDARWAVSTVGISQSERVCATSDECIGSLKCIAECIEPPAWLDQPSTCVHMQGYAGPHISRMHQRKSHQRMVLSSRNSAVAFEVQESDLGACGYVRCPNCRAALFMGEPQ